MNDCPICYNKFDRQHKWELAIRCGHRLCLECLTGIIREADTTTSTELKCPFCRKQFYPTEIIFLRPSKDRSRLTH
ncbi:unnamed protein product, partial [Oikopleura dioica]